VTCIGFTGHQNLSPAVRRIVAQAVATRIAEVEGDRLIGRTSLAEGADQLFAFATLAAGGELHVIIPSSGYESSFRSRHPRDTYLALLRLATDSSTLPYPAPSEDAYMAAGREVVDGSDLLIAVWDGQQAAGRGGTADVVAYARDQGRDVEVIWPSGATRDTTGAAWPGTT
jgi:hypothetical protein